MNKFKLLLIGIIIVALSACSDYTATEETTTVSSDTIINTDGESDYYKEVKIFNDKLISFMNTTQPTIKSGNVVNKDELVKVTNQYILYLDGFNPSPITISDEEFDPHMKDLEYDARQLADYTLQYLVKEENVYKDLAEDSMDNINIHLSTLAEIENKYY
ncbi:hypothetical protein M3649_04250 [Ureibacillus chungkukjangi]|uniref:hypothetical protein n=1 Tax=Ureibacillus chungkukjangi TaxID=1202712 RepID=UPI00203EAEB6|nr:hypothetical protein [Ureibacillus chungkukjangi]MCM3387345.1 hypothetical protein [Ureibacillus chungkukjangi]